MSSPEAEPEIVNSRLTAISVIPHLALSEIRAGERSAAQAERGKRPALFEGSAGYVEATVYERARLLAGNRIQGPAIVEQMDSTTVIPPGFAAGVDRYGNLLIDVPTKGAMAQS